MTTSTATFIPAALCTAGVEVVYGGDTFRVAELLPIAVLGGWVLVANPSDGVGGWREERVALPYVCEDGLAELAGGVL